MHVHILCVKYIVVVDVDFENRVVSRHDTTLRRGNVKDFALPALEPPLLRFRIFDK